MHAENGASIVDVLRSRLLIGIIATHSTNQKVWSGG